MLLGAEKFMGVDIRVRVKGGGHVSQVYAIRQAISKSLIAYYQKCQFTNAPSLLLPSLPFLSAIVFSFTPEWMLNH